MKKLPHSSVPSSCQRGFSLVEMIGVLAIIAILAVIIVPKVFSTIASARITSAASSVGAIKTAVTEFSSKYGTIPLTGNNSRIDDLLFTDGLMEGRFTVKIGTQPGNPALQGSAWTRINGAWAPNGGVNQTGQSRIICVTSNPNATPTTPNGSNYLLGSNTNIPTGSLPAGARVISAVIVNCTGAEARELSLRIDGESGSQTVPTTADGIGRVVYAVPTPAGITTAYIYIAQQ